MLDRRKGAKGEELLQPNKVIQLVWNNKSTLFASIAQML